jgi:L-ascorbate metabolism protein UlaG (beta-lactamase superfamily)
MCSLGIASIVSTWAAKKILIDPLVSRNLSPGLRTSNNTPYSLRYSSTVGITTIIAGHHLGTQPTPLPGVIHVVRLRGPDRHLEHQFIKHPQRRSRPLTLSHSDNTVAHLP